jgi:hypothetical protein
MGSMRGRNSQFNLQPMFQVSVAMVKLPAGVGREVRMALGFINLSLYTAIHVIISLVAIVAGFVAVLEMTANRRLGFWDAVFLWFTIATSVTGFGFPLSGVTPGVVFGIISLAVLAPAVYALYVARLAGPWRWIYVVTTIFALELNVFVLIVQSFQKIGLLNALAPTQSEGPFQIAQAVALVLVIALAVQAVRKFRPAAA